MQKKMSEITKIPVGKIIITGDNPRQEFNLESLKHLGESIVNHGLLQPIIVRPKEDYYELVIGERRLRAFQLLGLKEIETKVQDLDDATCMELRLIENTHREDLSEAERGDAILTLLEGFPDKYPTISSIAEAINKHPQYVGMWVAKSRKLSDNVKKLINAMALSDRQARHLLKYNHVTQDNLAEVIIRKKVPTTLVPDFIKLYDANPKADLDDLADEAMGIKKVEIPIEKLTPKARKEVEKIIEEKKKLTEKARKEAIAKARKASRRSPRKVPTEELEAAAKFAAEELKEEQVREALERRLTKMKERGMKVPKEKEVITPRLDEIEIPFATRTRLEKSIKEPKRQVALAQAMVENKLDEWGRRRFIELAKNAPWANVEELAKMVKDESVKETFLVLEIDPKLRNALYMEMERRGEERMKDTVRALLSEKLEESGYIV